MVMQNETPAPVATEAKKTKRPRHGKTFLITMENGEVLTLDEWCELHDRSLPRMSHKLGDIFREDARKNIRLHENDECLRPATRSALRGRIEPRKFFVLADGSVVSGFNKDMPESTKLVLRPATEEYSLDGGANWIQMVWIKGEPLVKKAVAEAAGVAQDDPLA